jgi:hypothetical protein
VTGGDGLLEQLAADAAGRREDSQFHRMLPLSRVLSSEGAVTAMTIATAHNVTR